MHSARAAVLLLPVFLASCVTKPAAPAAQASANALRIVASDFQFAAPDTVAAGLTNIVMVNQGKEPHQAVVMRIDSGKAQVQAWMGTDMKSPPPFMEVGGIAGLSVGQTANFTASFGKGDYILICFVPDAKDGKPHVAHGMMLPFKVS